MGATECGDRLLCSRRGERHHRQERHQVQLRSLPRGKHQEQGRLLRHREGQGDCREVCIPRLPMVLTFHYDEDGKQYEIRKTQFFEDMTIYYSDDKTRRVGLLKKGEPDEDFKFISLAPKRPGKKAAAEPQV